MTVPETVDVAYKPMPKYHWWPGLPSKHLMYHNVPQVAPCPTPTPHPTPAPAPTPQPTSADLTSYMSPVEDQGNIGSCTGNALVGLLEYLENKKAGTATSNPNFTYLSRLFVYYNERVIEGTVNADAGAVITDGINSLVKWGVCSEKLWPYVTTQFNKLPPIAAYSDGGTRKIRTYTRVAQTEQALIDCLNAGQPVVFGFAAYESFESANTTRTGVVSMPNVQKEKLLGGHAMLICGYSSVSKVFKARNSWGPNWGDRGYGYFPFAYLLDPELSTDFWTIVS